MTRGPRAGAGGSGRAPGAIQDLEEDLHCRGRVRSKTSPSPNRSPVSRSPVKIAPKHSSGHRSLPSRPSAPSKPSRPIGAAPWQNVCPGRATKYEHSDWEDWSDREWKEDSKRGHNRIDKSWIELSRTKERARPRSPQSTPKSTPKSTLLVTPVRKTTMSHDPLEDILQEPIVKEIKECKGPGRIQSIRPLVKQALLAGCSEGQIRRS